MTNTANSAAIERVRKLLAMSVGQGCTQAEAETAMAMAARVMAENAITMAEIEAAQTTQDDNWVEMTGAEETQHNAARSLLCPLIERFFFVEVYMWRGNRKVTYRFFGKPENVETAVYVFNTLQGIMIDLWVADKARHGFHTREKRPYMAGVVQGLADKMRAERASMDVQKQGTGSALAVISNKVTVAFQAKHGKMGFAPSKSWSDSADARQAGREAGSTINLARSVGKAAPRGLPRS